MRSPSNSPSPIRAKSVVPVWIISSERLSTTTSCLARDSWSTAAAMSMRLALPSFI
uniref:Uncharacterized protein n=1 Tax=uncultured marine virus TaxID=186617 RepID=A0A0F7L558_9VIRU|nr:hypothetical protein [uncultured marine virus]